jgi:DNA-binding NtrC family response regulator
MHMHGPNQTGGLTVLVVEDEGQVRLVLKAILRNHGCNVLDAGCAEEALKVWREFGNSISLLVTDIIMPGAMSGWSLAAECRVANPSLPVIFTSGYSGEMERMETALLKNSVFLEKPFNPEMFLEAFRRSLALP